MNLSTNLTQWRERFFSSTRGRVMLLVRRGGRTVNELADDLELTDNAVRAHLVSLERDGLVERSGLRPGTGKPSYEYQTTAEAETLFEKAYAKVLTSLIEVASDELDDEHKTSLLRTTGQRLASELNVPTGLSLHERAELAASVLTELGGLAGVEHENGQIIIDGASCPLMDVASARCEICQVAAAMIHQITGQPPTIQCQRHPRPRCRFAIEGQKG